MTLLTVWWLKQSQLKRKTYKVQKPLHQKNETESRIHMFIKNTDIEQDCEFADGDALKRYGFKNLRASKGWKLLPHKIETESRINVNLQSLCWWFTKNEERDCMNLPTVCDLFWKWQIRQKTWFWLWCWVLNGTQCVAGVTELVYVVNGEWNEMEGAFMYWAWLDQKSNLTINQTALMLWSHGQCSP